MDQKKTIKGITMMLEGLGLDLEDANFIDTPHRIYKGFLHTLGGLKTDIKIEMDLIFSKKFPTDYEGIVKQKNIKVYSKCPHHFETIEYTISFGYIAKEYAVGLSKITRAIKLLSQRPVMQETLTKDIIDTFQYYLKPKGLIVIVSGVHNCMRVRGVEQENVDTITSSIKGIFETDKSAREEFLKL